MSDLIDRQQAIDALHMHLMYRMGTDSNKKRLDDWINGLPSAEPESCKYWDAESNFCALSRPSAQPEPEEFEWCTGCKEYDQEAHCCHRWTKVIRNTVEEIKIAQTEPRWIPVTERLPEIGEKVLVSTKYTVFTQVFKRIYGTPDRWGWEHNTIKKVTAWMPLPEPWKGEADG